MKILIPTDYSVNALHAFNYTLNLLSNNLHEFIFLNIQNVRHAGAIITMDVNEDLVKHSQKRMKKLISEIKSQNPELKIEGHVTAGTFVESVIEKVTEFGVDLVTMGTKGAGGIKGKLMGSNTSNLIGHCTAPLIVVPENTIIENPRRALLAVDFVKDPIPETYDILLDICYSHSTFLNIIHVLQPNEKHFNQKDIPFNTEGLEYNLIEQIDTDVEHAIIDFVSKNSINLIGIVKSKGGFIHNLFHSSLTKKLGMHTASPLLVMV